MALNITKQSMSTKPRRQADLMELKCKTKWFENMNIHQGTVLIRILSWKVKFCSIEQNCTNYPILSHKKRIKTNWIIHLTYEEFLSLKYFHLIKRKYDHTDIQCILNITCGKEIWYYATPYKKKKRGNDLKASAFLPKETIRIDRIVNFTKKEIRIVQLIKPSPYKKRQFSSNPSRICLSL